MSKNGRHNSPPHSRVNGAMPLAIPGRVNVQVIPHAAPLSQPVTLAHPVPNGIALHILGGFTPLQEITKALASAGNFILPNEDSLDPDNERRKNANAIVAQAVELLAACERHQAKQAEADAAELQAEAGPEQENKSPILTE